MVPIHTLRSLHLSTYKYINVRDSDDTVSLRPNYCVPSVRIMNMNWNCAKRRSEQAAPWFACDWGRSVKVLRMVKRCPGTNSKAAPPGYNPEELTLETTLFGATAFKFIHEILDQSVGHTLYFRSYLILELNRKVLSCPLGRATNWKLRCSTWSYLFSFN